MENKTLEQRKDELDQFLYKQFIKREEAYIQARIRENEKWHSFWKFLKWLFLGDIK